MSEKPKLNRTYLLVGTLAWIVLIELKNLSPGEVSPVKYSDLKSHMIENFDNYPFRDRDFALEVTKKGELRWLQNLGWAGTLLKRLGLKTGSRGYWKITEKGENFLQEHPGSEDPAIEELALEYKKFDAESSTKKPKHPTGTDELEGRTGDEDADTTGGVDEDAIIAEIASHIERLDPYEFQELIGFLFEGMGYTVSHIAGKGPDGGIDLIAHRDPLGVEGKIVKIQAKHSKNTKKAVSVGSPEVQQLNGICANEQSHGAFISAKGFTSAAEKLVITGAASCVTLIDLSRFIDLWIEHIDSIPQERKAMLPLKQIYILMYDD